VTREPTTPGPDHPITVERNPERVVVRVGDQVIADTTSALTLQEADYPAVQYIPLGDVDSTALQSTDTITYCPYKGDASYYSLTVTGVESPNFTDAVWTYENPYPAVAEIASHVAFYADRVEITVGQ
jgi:uncharacterized protein (DUF427 family)